MSFSVSPAFALHREGFGSRVDNPEFTKAPAKQQGDRWAIEEAIALHPQRLKC